MKLLFAYISLLMFGGLILLACNYSLQGGRAMQSPKQQRVTIKNEGYSFYPDMTETIFPLLKN